MARDYYEVLGVGATPAPDEIQRAYRRLARPNHPDVNKDPAAEDRFKEVNEAYHVLSDPQTRGAATTASATTSAGFPRTGTRTGSRPRAAAAGRGGPLGTAGSRLPGRRVHRFRGGPTGGGAGVDIEDLLGGLFGAGPARRRRSAAPTRRPNSR